MSYEAHILSRWQEIERATRFPVKIDGVLPLVLGEAATTELGASSGSSLILRNPNHEASKYRPFAALAGQNIVYAGLQTEAVRSFAESTPKAFRWLPAGAHGTTAIQECGSSKAMMLERISAVVIKSERPTKTSVWNP